MARYDSTSRKNVVLAAALAWLVPGAGHIYLGRKVRGLVLMATLAATFWAGIAMGGIMTIDRDGEPWWFAADMLTGVHGLAAWRVQDRVYSEAVKQVPNNPSLRRGSAQWLDFVGQELAGRNLAIGHPTDTVARAYSGVAGMLNLLCIFDAAMLALMGASSEAQLRRRLAEDPARGSGV